MKVVSKADLQTRKIASKLHNPDISPLINNLKIKKNEKNSFIYRASQKFKGND